MTTSLPYPTAAPTPDAGQTDAKDATGRMDAMEVRSTRGGMPVVVADPAGPVALVTVSNYRGRRRLWWVGPHLACFRICLRLGILSVDMQPCAGIDELLSDEGDQLCN